MSAPRSPDRGSWARPIAGSRAGLRVGPGCFGCGGLPSAPADGGLEGTGVSEGRSGANLGIAPATLLVTGRMAERAFRLTIDESREPEEG